MRRAGLVQPRSSVRAGRVLCEVRRTRLQAASVLSTRAAQQRRARTGRRPFTDALQLCVLRLPRSRSQACHRHLYRSIHFTDTFLTQLAADLLVILMDQISVYRNVVISLSNRGRI